MQEKYRDTYLFIYGKYITISQISGAGDCSTTRREMKKQTYEQAIVGLNILKGIMKSEGLIFAIAIAEEDGNYSKIGIIDKDKFIKTGEADGLFIGLDELNRGLVREGSTHE